MRVRVVIAGIVILGALAGIMAVRATSRPYVPLSAKTSGAAADPQPSVSVSVATAKRGDIVSRVLAMGSVTSIRDAKIGTKNPGRVAAVLVNEGAHVGAGTPLLRLETNDLAAQQAQAQASIAAARAQLQRVLNGNRPQELAASTDQVHQAQATLRSAQASLSLAQANLQRMRSLQAQGAVSQQDLDSAQTQAQVAQAQVAQAQAAYDSAVQNASLVHTGSREEDIQQARAQLAQAEAGLAVVQSQIHDATIYAPFAGTITQRNVEPGETVSSVTASATSPLFVLSQLDNVYVELFVPSQHRFELQLDQQAVMAVEGLPGQTFQGRVEEIKPAADAANRTFGVKVLVPNPTGALRPGMFARGAIIVGARLGVLQIPEQAIVTGASGSFVFVVREGRAIRQAVTLGGNQGGMVEVTSGLTDGDAVVVGGQDALTDNQPVTVNAQ